MLVQTVVGLSAHKAMNRFPIGIENGPERDGSAFEEFAVFLELSGAFPFHVHSNNIECRMGGFELRQSRFRGLTRTAPTCPKKDKGRSVGGTPSATPFAGGPDSFIIKCVVLVF